MASNPLFVTTRKDLMKRLRLNEASVKSDSTKIIDTAIMEATVEIINALGTTRVNQILDYEATDSPRTQEQVERSDAIILETKLVRRNLLTVLQVMFVENAGGSQQEWNESGFLRDVTEDQIPKLIKRLTEDAGQSLERLETRKPEVGAGTEAASLGADDVDDGERLEPGYSVWD